jgi:hypothetical protein
MTHRRIGSINAIIVTGYHPASVLYASGKMEQFLKSFLVLRGYLDYKNKEQQEEKKHDIG